MCCIYLCITRPSKLNETVSDQALVFLSCKYFQSLMPTKILQICLFQALKILRTSQFAPLVIFIGAPTVASFHEVTISPWQPVTLWAPASHYSVIYILEKRKPVIGIKLNCAYIAAKMKIANCVYKIKN